MKRIDLIQAGGFAAETNLVANTVPVPTLADDSTNQVVIQVKATAVNPVDWKQAAYNFFLPDPLPAALGCDVAGIVMQASTDSAHLLGKRVVAYMGADKTTHATDRGAYVEQVLMDADVVAEVPDSVSYADAATLPVGALTASFLLHQFPSLPPGSWVLVWGASSSVGFNCVQLAKKKGFKVIAVASSKHKQLIDSIGADGFVDYRTDNVEEKVTEILGSDKLNVAADTIGEPDTFGSCASLVAAFGDPAVALTVSSTGFDGVAPEGVKKAPVLFAKALDIEEERNVMKGFLANFADLKPLPVRLIKGPFAAATVEEGFKASQAGASGEKIVIEWTE